MARNRSRRRQGGRSPSFRDQDELARVLAPLDDPASEWIPDHDQYDDLIHTGLIDSRPDPSLRSRSPWLAVRATMRSSAQPGRDMRSVVEGRELFRRALNCARRSVRREVLFALGRTGAGAGAVRRRRDVTSKEKC